MKWSNTLATNALSVFDRFVRLELKGLMVFSRLQFMWKPFIIDVINKVINTPLELKLKNCLRVKEQNFS